MTTSADPVSPVRVFFDAILEPHRSLGRTGFLILMGACFVVTTAVSLVFYLLGAWPVVGFLGLDVLILWLAFRANYRAARLYERVRLTESELTVQRIAWRQPDRRWSFQPYWLRVEMDDPPEHESQVTIRSHGRMVVVGSFLTPEERLEFANALRGALRVWRHAPGAPCRPEPVG